MRRFHTRGSRLRGRAVGGTTAVVVASAAAVIAAAPASATVSTGPARWTPKITSADSMVRRLAVCGSQMFAVGSFSSVSQGGHDYHRRNAFSFSATTGQLTRWNPRPNGRVNSIALSADCSIAYLGGNFTAIGGTFAKHLAAVSTTTGALITGFRDRANAEVETVTLVNGHRDLLVGGYFTWISRVHHPYYASLNPVTGLVNSYLKVSVSGRLPPNAGPTHVYNQQRSPRGDRLLFEGDFTKVNGITQLQVVQLDISPTAATLDPWHDHALNTTQCYKGEQFYVRAAAFSPDESTIYLATTGGHGTTSPYCDAAVAFTNTPTAKLLWINKTGSDSLYTVAAGRNDVYIGGHERWADNPQGDDTCGPGCVPRKGVGDISVKTGKATSWNPGRSRGKGADDMVLTRAGLWVASDTYYGSVWCAGQYHPGICFFPGTA